MKKNKYEVDFDRPALNEDEVAKNMNFEEVLRRVEILKAKEAAQTTSFWRNYFGKGGFALWVGLIFVFITSILVFVLSYTPVAPPPTIQKIHVADSELVSQKNTGMNSSSVPDAGEKQVSGSESIDSVVENSYQPAQEALTKGTLEKQKGKLIKPLPEIALKGKLTGVVKENRAEELHQEFQDKANELPQLERTPEMEKIPAMHEIHARTYAPGPSEHKMAKRKRNVVSTRIPLSGLFTRFEPDSLGDPGWNWKWKQRGHAVKPIGKSEKMLNQ